MTYGTECLDCGSSREEVGSPTGMPFQCSAKGMEPEMHVGVERKRGPGCLQGHGLGLEGGGLWKVDTNDVGRFMSACSVLCHILVLRALDICSYWFFTTTFWGKY